MSIEDILYGLLKTYKGLPYPIKNIIGRVYRIIPAKVKYGKFYFSYLKRIDSNHTPMGFLLKKQMVLCNEKLLFYKSKNYKKISDFPIITKSIIKTNFKEFINSENRNIIKSNTGGSSGTPFEFFLEKGISRPKEKAHFDWYWKQFGYTPGDKVLMIRGEALAGNKLYEYQAIENKLAVSCYLINKSNVAEVVEAINKFNPKFIHAYPSALKSFIEAANQNKTLFQLTIQAIFLGSEGLIDKDKKHIESFFSSKVAHWYGHSERLIHAGNCLYSDEFHIFDFYGFAELVDYNNEVITLPEVKGRIIATGFDNTVMPLVRYDTGDEAEYSINKRCKCGFEGRSFKKIHGRGQDYIYLIDKAKVSLTAFIFGQHFEEFTVIKELQIEQHNYGKIEIKIVLHKGKSIESLKFTNKLKNSVKNKLEISLIFVDSISKTSRGKHVFLIQKINN